MQGHNMQGGTFYALSDELVEKMQRASYGEDLDEVYEYESVDESEECLGMRYLGPLFDRKIPNEPREVLCAWRWYPLTVLLEKEKACGAYVFPGDVAAGYSFSYDVKKTAARLSKLTDDEIRKRYERNIDKMGNYAGEPYPLEELTELVHEVTAFYQRTAANGHAVMFYVT
jgi:hypothetical protein